MIASLSAERIDRHLEWMKTSGVTEVNRRRWLQRLPLSDAPDRPAAEAEVIVREMLEAQGLHVKAHELIEGSAGPDFRCRAADGAEFLVEVTTVSIERMTKETNLSYDHEGGARYFRPWAGTQSVSDAANRKYAQCSGFEIPVVLVVATWHSAASFCVTEADSVEPLLWGSETIRKRWNAHSDETVGQAWTEPDFDQSVFYRRPTEDVQSWEPGLQSISLLCLCALSLLSPFMRGVMNPGARCPFNPVLLPGTPIGQLVSNKPRGTRLVWHNEAEPAGA